MTLPSWRDDKRTTTERGYGWRWQQARAAFLQAHPLCAMCMAQTPPRIEAATTVDHRIPHRGDQALFWDTANWQSLCTQHHSGDKQAIEKSGHAPQRIGLDGFPIEEPQAQDASTAPVGTTPQATRARSS